MKQERTTARPQKKSLIDSDSSSDSESLETITAKLSEEKKKRSEEQPLEESEVPAEPEQLSAQVNLLEKLNNENGNLA